MLSSHMAAHAQGPGTFSETPSTSQSLVNAAGIVTHLNYPNTVYYTNFSQVQSALEKLGIHHIRDGYFVPSQYPQVVSEHKTLASKGITTDYVIPYDSSISPADIQDLAKATGDMTAMEAPNECDVLGQCGGGGNTGILNAVAYLPMLKSAANELNVPLLAPAFVNPSSYPVAGNLDSDVALNSLHLYFGGRYPGSQGWGDYDPQGHSYGSLAYWLDQANIDAPGKPSDITETGYLSFPSTSTSYTVPESVTASYIPRTLLLAFKHGYDKIYFYQLIDDPTSPQGYGLLRNDFSEKPGFTALKNLFSLLSDANWNKFTPKKLTYTISGGDSNVNHLLLAKSDGSYLLVLWLEESSWDTVNCKSTPVKAENISIQLGAYHSLTDYQFNSTGGVVAFKQPMHGSSTSLTVTDQLSIVQIWHN